MRKRSLKYFRLEGRLQFLQYLFQFAAPIGFILFGFNEPTQSFEHHVHEVKHIFGVYLHISLIYNLCHQAKCFYFYFLMYPSTFTKFILCDCSLFLRRKGALSKQRTLSVQCSRVLFIVKFVCVCGCGGGGGVELSKTENKKK